MRYLLIAPQFGFESIGRIVPGGLLQFSRCLARALSAMPWISQLDVWSQVDLPQAGDSVKQMLQIYAHSQLDLQVRCFGGSRLKMGLTLAATTLTHKIDRVMYVLVNQAELGLLPWHPPYHVWEIGRELFVTTSEPKRLALRRATLLLSISQHTAQQAALHNDLPAARVVPLCVEPPLFELEQKGDHETRPDYDPANRECAVLIVGNLHRGLLYKGHRQLIEGWPEVIKVYPRALLWIAGDGNGRSELMQLVQQLPADVAKQIVFWGRIDSVGLNQLYRRCRVFAMPSTGEGFGLVFVEAARHGLPCIAGKYDAAREIVIHHETGLLVEQHPHDIAMACIKLLADDVLARRLGEAAYQRYLSNYRFEHFRRRLMQALEVDMMAGSS